MEVGMVVIGVNFGTAPVAVRERFWIGDSRRYDALLQLARAEGVEEIVVLATCNRTEFIMWASDEVMAASSILNFLTHEYGLQLAEWKNFYRLLDEAALSHIFRVASGLDSTALEEPEIVGQVKAALSQAQQAGTAGRFLDTVFQKALTTSRRVRNETATGSSAVSVPCAVAAKQAQLIIIEELKNFRSKLLAECV